MPLRALERILAEKIGLNAEAVGRRAFRAVIEQRMSHHSLVEVDQYLALVLTSPAEREELIETVVVPETWFFRDHEPFRLLARFVTQACTQDVKNASRTWRILSLPCATGEEAYSAAITLADVGLPLQSIEVVGVDISQRALARAREGVYGERSFRHPPDTGWKRHFTQTPHGRKIDHVRQCVRFVQGNAIDPLLLTDEPAFDVVFCRNLLIYLTEPARKAMAVQLARWLRVGGLLFLGHAEAADPPGPGFSPIEPAGAFALERTAANTNESDRNWDALLKSSRKQPRARRVHALASLPTLTHPSARLEHDAWTEASRLADRGELAAAAEHCDRLLSEQGPSARGYCLLGVIHQASGRLHLAEACFDKAIELDPDDHETLVHLMLLCERSGRAGEAAKYRTRIQQAPTRGGAR